MTLSSLVKSTNVRFIRAGFRAGEAIAPHYAAHVAVRMWFTLPPGARGSDLPEGGRPFEVQSQGAIVRGHSWGDGPVVYLMHGWAGRGSQLAGFVEPLVERGHRVVLFDALSHGASDPGPSGPRSATGLEFAEALGVIAATFGPAAAVVAHSMGAVSTFLALRDGRLSAERLVLVSPMSRFSTLFDTFQAHFGIGARTRRHADRLVGERVGVAAEEFDVARLAGQVDAVPTLVVHDRKDRQTSYAESVELVAELPDARLVTTSGLGHHRLLADPRVIDVVTSFAAGQELTEELPVTA